MRNQILSLCALLLPGVETWGQTGPDDRPFGIGLET